MAYNAFVAMTTQWRTGFGGVIGLDYNVLPTVFRLTGVPRKDWPETFECLRFMEAEGLKVMGEERND